MQKYLPLLAMAAASFVGSYWGARTKTKTVKD